MKKILISILFLFSSIVVFCQTQIPKNLIPLISKSAFIFKGTILLKNTSTMVIENVDNLIVVRVDEIIESREHYKNLKGKLITVKSANIKDLIVGDKRVFLTNGLIWGESLCVLEIGNYIVKDDFDIISSRNQVKVILEDDYKKEMKDRFNKSSIVIIGKILKIDAIDFKKDDVSEHYPFWNKAELQVTETLKGDKNKLISFYFPKSNDVMWENSPKFKIGESGLWFLNSAKLLDTEIIGYSIISHKSFISIDVADKVKDILK